MPEETVLTESVAALSQFLVGDHSLQETLQHVADLAVNGVPAADGAGLALDADGRGPTMAHTDEAVGEIDAAQQDAGDGPGPDASRRRQLVRLDSMRSGPYPAFRAAAEARGILSALSVPLHVADRPLGALNLYARRAEAFTTEDEAIASRFASHAAILIANAQAFDESTRLSTGLLNAMESRAMIEQAKGIIMGSNACDADEAFAILVKASQRENVKLRDLARRIVDETAGRGRPSRP